MRSFRVLLVVGLAALMMFGVVPAASAATVTATYDYVTYSADPANLPAGATAVSFQPPPGTTTAVIRPTVILDGIPYNVTTIGDSAFESKNLSSVTIPNSVTTIAHNAFVLNDLTLVTIPNSVITIGDGAFNANALTSVTIGNSVTSIGDSAFEGNQLTSVIIPNSVTSIGVSAFYTNSLTLVNIPNSVTTIGGYAFAHNKLTSVTIGNSVSAIGNSAFRHNDLTLVIIPNSVITIGDFAFYNNSLTSVTIGNSVTTINFGAFSYNPLTSVIIPNSVTTIGDGVFDANSKLTSVQFLGAAPTMGSGSLGGAKGLLVSFFARYGAPVVSGGFTTPHWTTDLYLTQALVSVSYSNNGGDGLAPPDSQPPVGSAFSAPADPSWAGHTFTGWFTAASGGRAWNFSTGIVSADTTLFAQWSIIPTLAATGIDVTQLSRITGGAATMLLLGITAIIIHRRRRRRKANL